MNEEALATEEMMRNIMSSPLGLTAKFIFLFGSLLLFVLMITRQKMSVKDSALAMIGFRPIAGRDWLINVVHISAIVVPLLLFLLAARNI